MTSEKQPTVKKTPEVSAHIKSEAVKQEEIEKSKVQEQVRTSSKPMAIDATKGKESRNNSFSQLRQKRKEQAKEDGTELSM